MEGNNQVMNTSIKKSKSKKGLIIFLIVLLILILTAVVSYFVLFTPQRVVRTNINGAFNGMNIMVKDYYKNQLKYDLEKESIGVSGDLVIDSDYNGNGIFLNKLKNYKLNYNVVLDKPSNKASALINIKRVGKDFVNLSYYVNGKTMITDYGDLFNRTEKKINDIEVKDIEIGSSASEKDIITLLDRTKEFSLKHLSNDKFSKKLGIFEVKGKKGLYNKITYIVNIDKYRNDLVKFYKSDDKSMEALINITGMTKKKLMNQLEFYVGGYDEKEDQRNITVNAYYNMLPFKYKYLEVVDEKDRFILEPLKNIINFNGYSENKEIIKGLYDYSKSNLKMDLNDDDSVMNLDITMKDNNANGTVKYVEGDNAFNITFDSKTTLRKNNDSMTESTIDFDVNGKDLKFKMNIKSNMEVKTKVPVTEVKEKNSFTAESISEKDYDLLANNGTKKLLIFFKDVYPEYASLYEQG